MNWQLAITIVLIAAAALVVGRAALRSIRGRGRGGCGPRCSQCAAPAPQPVPGRINLPQFPSNA